MIEIITPFPIDKQLQLSVYFSEVESNLSLTGVRYCLNEMKSIDSDSNDAFLTQTTLSPKQLAEKEFIQKIKKELKCYLDDGSFHFSLPCHIELGTPFQQKVWRALAEIPSGEVKTYGRLAKELNSSAQAIGNACRNNLFPVIIPCHRVVSASGIGGYAGDTLDVQKGQIHFLRIKQWLLTHEATAREKRK